MLICDSIGIVDTRLFPTTERASAKLTSIFKNLATIGSSGQPDENEIAGAGAGAG